MNSVFSISRIPRVIFGRGCFEQLDSEIGHYGSQVLLVTGGSFARSQRASLLQGRLLVRGVRCELVVSSGEPSPGQVDQIVSRYGKQPVDAVVGIGGGSALDLAKAVAGLLSSGDSVMGFLEGVGNGREYRGGGLPLIAVPTTAGTGSEMTKNAVLSVPGPTGFKRSFRHEDLVADLALVDPELLVGCPLSVRAANAMDALTQLLESYVSKGASPFTDALALSAMELFQEGFSEQSEADLLGLDQLAYAAMVSGVCLAQSGLGAVHGLAASLGGLFPIPHGQACGTLLAVTTRANIRALRQRAPDDPALDKYAVAGRLLCRQSGSRDSALAALEERLGHWTQLLAMPRLADYGIQRKDLPMIIADSRNSSMRFNPILLSDEELEEILIRRL